MEDIDALLKKIMSMQDLALMAHKIKFDSPARYNQQTYQKVINNIKRLAGEIYND